jgi:RNA polymerase sigma-70 factor, ECF subfamily
LWELGFPKSAGSSVLCHVATVERDELGKLYERYGFLVHRRCRALLRNEADAADALQETFWRVQRYGRPPGLREPLAWLYGVAANVCFDKGTRRRRDLAHDEKVGQGVSHHTGSADDGDRRAVVGFILQKFDDDTRTIGVLHHLDGMTQEEIAVQTGYSRKTVGKKLALFEEAFKRLWASATGGPS